MEVSPARKAESPSELQEVDALPRRIMGAGSEVAG